MYKKDEEERNVTSIVNQNNHTVSSILLSQFQNFSTQCIWIKYKQVIMWCSLLRYCLDYFLSHDTTNDGANRTDLCIQIAPMFKNSYTLEF